MNAFDKISRDENGRQIPGKCLPVFIHSGDYFLTELRVYQDGVIDCWQRVTLTGLRHKIEEGWVVTKIPEDAKVHVHHLASFNVTNVRIDVEEEELLKEVADAIEDLNGRQRSSDRCVEAWKAYRETPSEANKLRLKQTYEAVPQHLRRYLGDQDVKDHPIRMVLYGAQEQEKWSHRIAAKQAGIRPPSLDIPRPFDESDAQPKAPAEPQRKKLAGHFKMALVALYCDPGIGEPIFARERHDEVYELCVSGNEGEGVKAFLKDLAEARAAYAHRPQILVRLSSALSQFAEQLESRGQWAAAIEAHVESASMNPDGASVGRLMEIAVTRQDAALAKRLVELRRALKLSDVPERASLLLRVAPESFRALLEK